MQIKTSFLVLMQFQECFFLSLILFNRLYFFMFFFMCMYFICISFGFTGKVSFFFLSYISITLMTCLYFQFYTITPETSLVPYIYSVLLMKAVNIFQVFSSWVFWFLFAYFLLYIYIYIDVCKYNYYKGIRDAF